MDAGHVEEHSVSTGTRGAESWVGAVAVCRASDLAASGAGDGSIQLWALKDTNRILEPLHKLPVVIYSTLLRFYITTVYCGYVFWFSFFCSTYAYSAR